MKNLLGTTLVCWGVTLLVAAGCGGDTDDGPSAGGSDAGGSHSGGNGGKGGDGANESVGGAGGVNESVGGAGGANEGGAGGCPVETFELTWRELNDAACTSEGLVCHKGSDTCGPGTLVASTETLSCRNGKWYWPGYSERWCCPDLAKLADFDGDACRDDGHVCYGGVLACEPQDLLTCDAGTWQLSSRTPDGCGGAGGAGAGGANTGGQGGQGD